MATDKTKQLRILFDRLDINGDGVVDLNDYHRSYRSKKDFMQHIGVHDTDGDGKMSFEEFCDAFEAVTESTDTFYHEDGLVKWLAVFQHYDTDGSGYLELEELRDNFVAKGFMTEDQVIALMQEMDVVEKDGRISLVEFILYHLREDKSQNADNYRPGQIISKKV